MARGPRKVLNAGSPVRSRDLPRSGRVMGVPKYSTGPLGADKIAPVPQGEASVVIVQTVGMTRACA
eukprot:9768145-Alexandrium_andersonii.AAC.1